MKNELFPVLIVEPCLIRYTRNSDDLMYESSFTAPQALWGGESGYYRDIKDIN